MYGIFNELIIVLNLKKWKLIVIIIHQKYIMNDPEKLKEKHLNTIFKFIIFDNSLIMEDLGT